MAIKIICGMPNECQEEDVMKHKGMLEKIGIHTIFTHLECSWSTSPIEISHKTMLEEDIQPLQGNSLYAFTQMESKTPNPVRYPVLKYLLKSRDRETFKVFLSTTLPQEKDIREFPIDIRKDLVFMDEFSMKEIGWYNQYANILWLSDIFHIADPQRGLINTILPSVIELQRYGKLSKTLLIGADPEFEIVDGNDNFINADRLFPEMQGEIGHDGHAATGEIRPKPASSPLALTRNIKRLVRKLNSFRTMSGNKVYAGGGVSVTTGGHIHFNIKVFPQELKDMMYDMVAYFVLQYQSSLRQSNERENISKTGSNVCREQPHGVEWRPLPSFIVNEEITCSILCTTYAIVKSYKFCEFKKRKVGKICKETYEAIPLYPIYKEWIDKFYELFVEGKVSKLYDRDILSEWKLAKIRKEFTVEIISAVDWVVAYFKPVNVKLKKNVKLELRFSGDTISCFGIPVPFLGGLSDFNDRHYLPPMVIQEKLTRGIARPTIVFPGGWWNMQRKTDFCKELKGVIRGIIIQIGGK